MDGCEYVKGWDCSFEKSVEGVTYLKKYKDICRNCIAARAVLTSERFIEEFIRKHN